MQSGFSKVGTLVLSFLLIFTATFAVAQVTTGAISGTVLDQQGAVISGAKVTATQVGTGATSTTTSNNLGSFRLGGLPIGAYSVKIESPKFRTTQISGVEVQLGRETALPAQSLGVGNEGEVVNVEGTAPLVENTTSQITNSFESRKASDIPGIGSGFDALALFVPGVVSPGDASFSNSNGTDLSVNGQRGRSNNFQIDGQANNDNSVGGPSLFLGNQDVIAEFQIVTNNFSAEYGRNMGSVVNYVTKAGTNAFHGTGYDFYTGSFTDSLANQEKSPILGFCPKGKPVGTPTVFAPGPTGTDATLDPDGKGCKKAKVSRYSENRYGGTFGGPIWKDKMWFFTSYQEDQIRQGGTPANSGNAITPTAAGVASLAAAFPGSAGVAELQKFGPFAIKAGNPTVTGATQILNVSNGTTIVPVEFGGVTRNLTSLFKDRQGTGRFDWQIGSKDRFFTRYIYEDTADTNVTGRFAAGQVVDVPGKTYQIGADWVRNWTNSFINQFRFNYSRADFGFEGGTTGCTRATVFSCPSGISFSSAGNSMTFGLQSNLPQGRLIKNTQYQDNATWVRGRHTLKFGGEYDRQDSPNGFLPNVNGTFTFRGNSGCARFGAITGAGTSSTNPTFRTACAFSNFLANTPNTFQLTDGPFTFQFKEQDMAYYFQDDWKIKDNLTLNLGLRWEWNQQAINLLHTLTVTRESNPSTAFFDTTLPLAQRTIAKIPEDYNNFGPNIGFAWTPRIWQGLFGQDKTVIRGGYRIAYDPEFYNMFLNVATAAPVVNAGTLNGQGTAPGLPAGGATGASLRAAGDLALIPRGSNPGFRNQTIVAPDFHNPYSEQWSLGIQRQLTSKMAFETRYVGNHTIGNFQTINANPQLCFDFAGGACSAGPAFDFANLYPGKTFCSDTTAPGFGRPDCNKANLRERANTAFSIYHSWQNELRIQNWHGLTSGLAYTYSKAIDNASEIFSTFGGGNTVAGSQNPFNTNEAERGVGGASFKHVASAYFIYDVGFMKGQHGLFGHVLGGWQVNGAYRYNSGQPFSVAEGLANSACDVNFNANFFGADTCRPILSNASAGFDTAGLCTDPTLADCGLVNFFTGDPTTASAVRYIYSDDTAAAFFKNPYKGVGRNTLRGQTFSNFDFGLFKNTKISERVNFQLQANVVNLLNRQYRGNPDPFVDDGRFDIKGSPNEFLADGVTSNPAFNTGFNPFGTFMNNYQNASNRRRMTLGAKIIF